MTLEDKIFSALKSEGRKGISREMLMKKVGLSREKSEILDKVIMPLSESGKVIKKNGKFILTKSLHLFPATIVSLHKSFGFASLENGEEVFVPGREMLGALPDDLVLLKVRHSALGDSREGKVVEIIKACDAKVSGEVIFERGKLLLLCDGKIKIPFEIAFKKGVYVREGDKISAKISRHSNRHFDYKAIPIEVFGDAQDADACSKAILSESGAPTEFPSEVLAEAIKVSEEEIHPKEISARLDLRKEAIFTIDSADSKDLDDAISVEKMRGGWRLGVHIADVSFYVKAGEELDGEALKRGTSIYYADKVIPMLPRELSNGICSLNPNEDRLTFSIIMDLDKAGNLLKYDIKKSVINSCVKGVYSEVNAILDKSADKKILKKYKGLITEIKLMRELCDVLIKKREARNSLEIVSFESKIVINEKREVVDIKPRTSGVSERIVEEFMLLANEAAATFAMKNALPFIYRVHEYPDKEKMFNLCTVLRELGIDTNKIEKKPTPERMNEILKATKGTKHETLVNNLLLRSLAKAKYFYNNLGHYGLVLENYAHFTSPIRRYPDLAIHRILTSAITGMGEKKIKSRYGDFVKNASSSSSNTELRAVKIERDCEDCYKAKYMESHIGEDFEGEISSVSPHGFYVVLPNTVEGMVRIEDLPEGRYDIRENIKVTNLLTGKSYHVGDKVKVSLVGVDVSRGNIDFVIAN